MGRHSYMSDEKRLLLFALVDEGKSWTAIAKALGYPSSSTACAAAKRYGLTKKPAESPIRGRIQKKRQPDPDWEGPPPSDEAMPEA
jgi:hypothetical protein